MSKPIILTNQQERFVIFAIDKLPKKYSKAATAQCMAHELNLDRKSIAKVLGVSKSYIDNSLAGQNVRPWKKRPESHRLLRFIKHKVELALTPLRLFYVEDSNDIYIATLDGGLPRHLPNRKSGLLCDVGYIGTHDREDVNLKIKSGKYEEDSVLLSPYRNSSISHILSKLK